VTRALPSLGEAAVRAGQEALARIHLVRVSDRILGVAGRLLPAELRSLNAIHLATTQELGDDLARVVTYDERMAAAASGMGWAVSAPT
jgi:uncharacterized protein